MIYIVPNQGSVVVILKKPEHKQAFLDFIALAEKGGHISDEMHRFKQLLRSHVRLEADLAKTQPAEKDVPAEMNV